MKTRESGMPEDALWSQFFNPPAVLRKLGLISQCGDAVDFGCGYGTFAIPAGKIIRGHVHALDIDPAMVAATQARAQAAGLVNVRAQVRDFIADGTGLPDGVADYAMLFNILHAEDPLVLLREASRVLRVGGRVGIMHWRFDPTTPRGPSMAIRPRPEQCRSWAQQVNFRQDGPELIDLPPFHYGLVFRKSVASNLVCKDRGTSRASSGNLS